MKPPLLPLADGLPEPWASEWGEDRYGVFMSFAIGNVVQRMRWIPPGRFWMGSPETEPGRVEDEGPQHEVVLTRGLWMADTACTQALWEAVMQSNPSQFRSPDRPVESVSWASCQVFLAKLNACVPGLEARLPTEAEWERACRAGTPHATWLGDLDIRGPNNAPILDAIAWYGGNSGGGFDLKEGENSGAWPDKQYPHTRAGTRSVAQKLPNPWGLYDMLGNVYEWCSDWKAPYAAELAVDPSGPRTGSSWVRRGGSWGSTAGGVRAASRFAYSPGFGDDRLGFRIVGAQAPGPGP